MGGNPKVTESQPLKRQAGLDRQRLLWQRRSIQRRFVVNERKNIGESFFLHLFSVEGARFANKNMACENVTNISLSDGPLKIHLEEISQ